MKRKAREFIIKPDMKPLTHDELLSAISRFSFEGNLVSIEENHNGHINDTFVLTFQLKEGEKKRYVLQRINTNVFPRIGEVMASIDSVLSYMEKKIAASHGDLSREKLTLIRAKDGQAYFEDGEDSFFRAYAYLEGSRSYNSASADIFGKSGYAFGKFQHDLDGFPAEKLFEVIPHFHDTPKRFKDLKQAIEKASPERKEQAKDAIDWALAHENVASFLSGKNLPIRVTHNDTKLNNVLFFEDGKTCVIDLDTVMPGLSLYDFGDSIRFGANTASEDEKDLSKVKLDLEYFSSYAKGYLSGAQGSLRKEEIELFPEASMTLTYECGIRFLADFLQGDTYFKISYPDHNLVRAKDQFALVDDMEKKLPEMREIVAGLLH